MDFTTASFDGPSTRSVSQACWLSNVWCTLFLTYNQPRLAAHVIPSPPYTHLDSSYDNFAFPYRRCDAKHSFYLDFKDPEPAFVQYFWCQPTQNYFRFGSTSQFAVSGYRNFGSSIHHAWTSIALSYWKAVAILLSHEECRKNSGDPGYPSVLRASEYSRSSLAVQRSQPWRQCMRSAVWLPEKLLSFFDETTTDYLMDDIRSCSSHVCSQGVWFFPFLIRFKPTANMRDSYRLWWVYGAMKNQAGTPLAI